MPGEHDEDFTLTEDRSADGVVRLAIAGELDLQTCPAVEDTLAALRAQRARVVLDLAGVTFVDSTGLSLLLDAHADASRDGWQLKIGPVSESVERLIELTQTHHLLRLTS